MAKSHFFALLFTLCFQEVHPVSLLNVVDTEVGKITSDGPFTCNGSGSAISDNCTAWVGFQTDYIINYLKNNNDTALGLVIERGIASCKILIPNNISVVLSSPVCATSNADNTTTAKFRFKLDNLIIRCDYGIGPTITGLQNSIALATQLINSTENVTDATCLNPPELKTEIIQGLQEIVSNCTTKNALTILGGINLTGVLQYMISNFTVEASYNAPADTEKDWVLNYSSLVLMNEIQVFNKRCEGKGSFNYFCNCLLENRAYVNLDFQTLNTIFSCNVNDLELVRCENF